MKHCKNLWWGTTICMIVTLCVIGCTNNTTNIPFIGQKEKNLLERTRLDLKKLASIKNKTIKRSIDSCLRQQVVHQGNHKNCDKVSNLKKQCKSKREDILFYIARITGNNYRNFGKENKIPKSCVVDTGKRLEKKNKIIISHNTLNKKNPNKYKISQILNNAIYKYHLDLKIRPVWPIFSLINRTNFTKQASSDHLKKKSCLSKEKSIPSSMNDSVVTTPVLITKKASLIKINEKREIIDWHWPTYGKILDNFSEKEGGNQGLDISGVQGQPILATTSGKVVYVGNTLRGYGNLIIIKHDYNYLSAYAHNDIILVQVQQQVSAGQRIATMGSTGTNTSKLHFEIRHKGEPVNPLIYLPNR